MSGAAAYFTAVLTNWMHMQRLLASPDLCPMSCIAMLSYYTGECWQRPTERLEHHWSFHGAQWLAALGSNRCTRSAATRSAHGASLQPTRQLCPIPSASPQPAQCPRGRAHMHSPLPLAPLAGYSDCPSLSPLRPNFSLASLSPLSHLSLTSPPPLSHLSPTSFSPLYRCPSDGSPLLPLRRLLSASIPQVGRLALLRQRARSRAPEARPLPIHRTRAPRHAPGESRASRNRSRRRRDRHPPARVSPLRPARPRIRWTCYP